MNSKYPTDYYRLRYTYTIYSAPTAGKLITNNQDIIKTFFSIAAAYMKLTPPINLNKEPVNSFKVNFFSLISQKHPDSTSKSTKCEDKKTTWIFLVSVFLDNDNARHIYFKAII